MVQVWRRLRDIAEWGMEMRDYIVGAWQGLSETGRMVVIVALVVSVTLVLVLGMAWRYDWALLRVLWGG